MDFRGEHDPATPYKKGEAVTKNGKLFFAINDSWGEFAPSDWQQQPEVTDKNPDRLTAVAEFISSLKGEKGDKGDKGDSADMEAVNQAIARADSALSASREVQKSQGRVILASEKAVSISEAAVDVARKSEKIAKESDKKAQKAIEFSIDARNESLLAKRIAEEAKQLKAIQPKDGRDGKDGLPGKDGKSITYKGEYVDGSSYLQGDIVKYEGEVLIASADTNKAPKDKRGRLRKGWDVLVDRTRSFGAAVHASILFKNAGNGAGIFKAMQGGQQEAKSLVAGSNITITEQTDTITIESTGGGGGTVQSASNIGAGTGIFAQLNGTDLEFKSLTTPDGKLTITDNTDEVDLQVNAVGLTGDESIDGVKTFNDLPESPATPTTNAQLTTKEYVDDLFATAAGGFPAKPAATLATTAALPAYTYNNGTGGVGATITFSANGNQTVDGESTTINSVILVKNETAGNAPYNGQYTVQTLGDGSTQEVWVRATYYDQTSDVFAGVTTPVTGGATLFDTYWYVTTQGTITIGTTGITIEQLPAATFTASLGVQKVGNDFRANLDAARAITLNGNAIGVNTGAGLTITANALTIANLGVTNAMLAGSIADSKLSTISTANKVNWNALIASAGKITNSNVNDIADVNAGSPTNGQALTWDTASSRWIASTISISPTTGGGEVIADVPFLVGAGANVAWTNMPAAVTELLGSAFNRVRYDLSHATEYRIVVNQAVAGFAGADLNLQYSTDNVTYAAADTGGAGEVDVGTGTGVKTGAWTNLVAGAKSDVFLRIVGKQGDGVADPAFRQIHVEFRIPVGTGDLVGPSSATDNAITRFDGTTGKLVQNSSATLDDSGVITCAEVDTTKARATTSAGLLIESNNGTDVALFGAGGGNNATFYGGVNINGAATVGTTLTLSNATQNIELDATGGVFTIQGQDSGENSYLGLFSKDGDGTDNVGAVYYGVGLPGSVVTNDAMYSGYVIGGTFQIFTSSSNVSSLPIHIYTQGNFGQFVINDDNSIDFDNWRWENIVIDDTPDVNILKASNQTAGNDAYFAISTATSDGTENTGLAVLAKGSTPVGTDIQAGLFTYDTAGNINLISYASGTEQANPLTLGVSDQDGGVNAVRMLRDGKTGWGVTDPTDLDLDAQIGVDIRPMITKYAVQASDIANSILGVAERYEGYEDETGNVSIYTIASGTRASPTATASAIAARDEIVLVYDGTDYLFAGAAAYTTLATATTGVAPLGYGMSLMDAAGSLTSCFSLQAYRSKLATWDGTVTLNEGWQAFEEDAYASNRGTMRFNDGTEDRLVVSTPADDLPADNEAPVFDTATNDFVPKQIVPVITTVNLTTQSASIGSTGFSNVPTAESLLRISYNLLVTATDAGAGTVEVDFAWHDGTAARTFSPAAIAMTATNDQSDSFVIRKGSAQTVSYSTVVSGTPGTARYALLITVERLT